MSTEPRTGFYPGLLDRSSFDILYTCFGTLFFCTWTTVYLNSPGPYDGYWNSILRKFKWMVITSVAPEITTCLALGQWLETRSLERRLRQLGGAPQWIPGPMERFYIAMGGYLVQYRDQEEDKLLVLSPEMVISFESRGIFLGFMGESFVAKKDHRDSLGIGLTTLQISWLIIHTISRGAGGLPISELELATIAIVFASTMNYLIWWKKPMDPEVTMIRPPDGSDLPPEVVQRASIGGYRASNTIAPLVLLRGLSKGDVDDKEKLSLVLRWIAVASVVFCSIHFAAWNWSFASSIEKWLWRFCSIACLMSSLGVIFCLWMITRRSRKRNNFLTYGFLIMFMVLYVVARACILVEVFIAFRSMPESLYVIQPWTRYYPHF